MARTINTIESAIITDVQAKFPGLSASKVAEWRLWAWIVAAAIHAFEVVLDLFRTEVETKAASSTVGTKPWYALICRMWQYGHRLVYDAETAGYGYASVDEDARIIKMVAINESGSSLYIKVAKQTDAGEMAPLSSDERQDFVAYMRKMTIAGVPVEIVTTTPDLIRYNLEVYYDAAYPQQTVRDAVIAALDTYKASLSFDSRVYAQRLVDQVMSAEGVVTVSVTSLEHKTSAASAEYAPVGVVTELAAGYFNYADNNTLTLTIAE